MEALQLAFLGTKLIVMDADSRRHLRVLLVDDEPDILLLLQTLLSVSSWEIVGKAPDGPTALRVAETIEPDVAVIDYMMPGMDGVEVAGHLRARHPSCRIVMFSAYPKPVQEGEPAFDHWLQKTDVGALIPVITRIAEERGFA